MNVLDLTQTDQILDISKAPKSLLEDIQTLLSKLSLYPADEIDGIYGPKTQAAWSGFKHKHNQGDLHLIGPGSANLLLKDTAQYVKDRVTVKLPPASLPPSNLANRIYNLCMAREYPLDLRRGAVNIFGLEGLNTDGTPNNDAADGWNDSIGLLSIVDGVPKVICIYRGTTEPGKYYTYNPLNRGGAARLQVGYHKGIWRVGQHRGYEAMQQVGPAILVRDKNRNFRRDDVETTEWGNGINLHSTSSRFLPNVVSKFSAGCVVIQRWADFQHFMRLVKSSSQYTANPSARFDFFLIWRDWLN